MADQKIGGGYIEVKATGVPEAEKEIQDLQQDLKTGAISFEEFSRRAEEATQRLEQLKKTQNQPVATKAAAGVYELADAYDLVEEKFEQIVVAAPKVERAFDWTTIVSPKVRKLTEDFDFATIKLGNGLEKVGGGSRSATNGLGRFQQQITAGSYALQDFTSTTGDLGAKLNSISNNLPMILGGLGGLGLAFSTVATAGIAVYRNWDSISGAFQNQNAIPKVAGDLEGLRKKLADVSDQMDRMKAKGFLTDDQVGAFKNLQGEEEKLKGTIKTRETIDRLKEQRTDEENKVAKAFQDAIKETGAKQSLEALEKDLSSSQNPALKNLFKDIFDKIGKGNLDAFRALVDHAKTNPEYGNLAREMEQQLKSAFGQDGTARAMDDVVKKFKEDRKKEVEQLNKQGQEGQEGLMTDLAKEAEEGMTAIFIDPLKDMVIKGRANGVALQKEAGHLKDEVEAEAKRLFPFLEKAFPDTFKGIVAAIAGKVQEAVDKSIEQLRAIEGLTKEEAIRRLNQERIEKQQSQTEALALDEFTQAATRDANRQAAMTGGPRITPQQARERARNVQQRLEEAGVSAGGQVTIGKTMNTRGGERNIEEAMNAMMNAGFDEQTAMRHLPSVLDQMASGRQAQVAVNQLINANTRQQRGAANRAAAEAARGAPRMNPGRGGGGFQSIPAKAIENTGKLIGITSEIGGTVSRQQQEIENQARAIEALRRGTQSLQRTAQKRG